MRNQHSSSPSSRASSARTDTLRTQPSLLQTLHCWVLVLILEWGWELGLRRRGGRGRSARGRGPQESWRASVRRDPRLLCLGSSVSMSSFSQRTRPAGDSVFIARQNCGREVSCACERVCVPGQTKTRSGGINKCEGAARSSSVRRRGDTLKGSTEQASGNKTKEGKRKLASRRGRTGAQALRRARR